MEGKSADAIRKDRPKSFDDDDDDDDGDNGYDDSDGASADSADMQPIKKPSKLYSLLRPKIIQVTNRTSVGR